MELTEIKKQFDKVISFAYGIDVPLSNEMLEQWYENKKYFIDAFGGKLIYEYPEKVTIRLSPEDRKSNIKKFIEDLYLDYDYPELTDYIKKQEDGFYSNITTNDYKVSDKIKIRKGEKLIKSFKHFIKNPNELREIQDAASCIIQEEKTEGILCFSVHPLDYMTISENNNNWTSCHRMDGMGANGNLSFMLDKHTFIAYIKSDKDVNLTMFPPLLDWNNKKWRALLFLSEKKDFLFAGKPYPFYSTNGINLILEKLFSDTDILKNKKNWQQQWQSNYNKSKDKLSDDSDRTFIYDDMAIQLKNFVADSPNARHYNDLLYSKDYLEPLYICENSFIPYFPAFSIGSQTYCLECGKDITKHNDYEGTVKCAACEGDGEAIVICDNCGSICPLNEVTICDRQILCNDCCITEMLLNKNFNEAQEISEKEV